LVVYKKKYDLNPSGLMREELEAAGPNPGLAGEFLLKPILNMQLCLFSPKNN
jgi:hypothetical protein